MGSRFCLAEAYGYDAAGRTTSVTSSVGITTLTYDFESRITQISGPGINATYSYNGLDTRVGKTENSVANTFRRSGAYVTDPVLGDGSASYTPGVSVRSGGNVRYQHTGLKNTDSQTSPAQSVAASRIYDAFGNVVSSSGTWTGPFGYAGNFGYQQDASGLKLLGHRYYDPSTGRFLTRDPIKDGRNWYAYGAGEASPTNIADPDGLQVVGRTWTPTGTGSVAPGGRPGSFRHGFGNRIKPKPQKTARSEPLPGSPRTGKAWRNPKSKGFPNVKYERGTNLRSSCPIARLDLLGLNLKQGDALLRKAGLRKMKNPIGAGYVWVDKHGRVRARWDPAHGGNPAHWHKYADDGTSLTNRGTVVDYDVPAAHIRGG